MLTRGLSGLVFVALLVICMLYGALPFIVLFYVFMLLSIFEFSRMLKVPSIGLYFIGTLFFVNATPYLSEKSGFLFESLVVVSTLSLFIRALASKGKNAINQLANQLLCIAYSILPFLFIIKIPFLNEQQDYEGILILGVFVLVWTNDTLAYLVGRSFGKHKLLERISPKKTIEGFFGGVVFTMLLSYLIGNYYDVITPAQWMLMGALVSVFGVLGDLIASLFKRQTGVKDTGNIMPGHGGIIDRLDSVIFVGPFIYIYLKFILEYVS